MTAPDPALRHKQAVVPPAEIPSGPPVEPSAGELRAAQELARIIRDRRLRYEAAQLRRWQHAIGETLEILRGTR